MDAAHARHLDAGRVPQPGGGDARRPRLPARHEPARPLSQPPAHRQAAPAAARHRVHVHRRQVRIQSFEFLMFFVRFRTIVLGCTGNVTFYFSSFQFISIHIFIEMK